MYLTINKEDIIKKKDIIGIFNIESIIQTKEYYNILEELKKENRIKKYAKEEEKTIILYQKDKKTYGIISNISSNSIEKRIKSKTI